MPDYTLSREVPQACRYFFRWEKALGVTGRDSGEGAGSFGPTLVSEGIAGRDVRGA